MRRKIMELTGLLVKNEKAEGWLRLVNLLLQVREIVDSGEETSEAGKVSEWIRTYLHDKPPRVDRWEEDITGRAPFVRNGVIYIFSRHFYAWVADVMKEKLNQNEMAALLSRYGCEPEQIALTNRRTGSRSSTSARRLPPESFPVEEYVKV
jgi:hypothetical protein